MTRGLRRACGATVCALCMAVAVQSSGPAASPRGTGAPRAPARLADTGLYLPGRPGVIDPLNRAFAPQYPLWSDGLTKRRWIRLPAGAVIDDTDPYAWDFPVGTRFWKEFSHRDRKVETRMLWKASGDHWVYAAYAWNADGSEATLAPDTGLHNVVEVSPGRRHTIPGTADCAACHGVPAKGGPIGFTALQLSADRDPNAIHGEPLADGMVTLPTLLAEGLLMHSRAGTADPAPSIRTGDPVTRSVLGYFVANCAMCHNGRGEITAAAPVIRVADLVSDADAVARGLLGQKTRWQAPGVSEGTLLVHDGRPDASALLLRMRSRSPSSQMPPLGSVVRDQDAVDAVTRWIAVGMVRSH